MPSLFKIPIQSLSGVGNRRAELFKKLGIDTVGTLLRFYPRSYEDWSNPYNIASAPLNEVCCIKAKFDEAFSPLIKNKIIIFKVNVCDEFNYMTVTFFNQKYLFDNLRKGGEFLFYGILKYNNYSSSYEMVSPAVLSASKNQNCIHPVYQQTANLTSKQIANAMQKAIAMLPEKTNDPIPNSILKQFNICTLDFAIKNIHFPANQQALETARKRLIFEELLILQLGMARLKGNRKEASNHKIKKDFTNEFYDLLPFKPTNAQKRAISQCIWDMSQLPYPMNRLVQGDVGSGKTAVAAASCYTAVKNGLQCAFMAPTEILASQHYKSLTELFQNSNINIELLVGSMTISKKRKIYERLKNGEIDIIIGTHTLISDSVEFMNLGLVITDEQHRFGVNQRSMLISKGNNPHTIVMSATPIPRTLALMIFGDLDLSILDELPPGRQKTDTFLINAKKRDRAYNFLKKNIDNGNQCYVVCPLVEQNDTNLASAEEYINLLKKSVLSDCKIKLLHGKMKASEKDHIMSEFADGNIDILVSTTVIEVGVNVPNSTIMMIENAERFGLSQLHQLRGRVGRGTAKSFCILVSDIQKESSLDRLRVMCKTNDGFKIADEDLKMRGPGDFFGSRQHGLPELKIAGMSSMDSVKDTQLAAKMILDNDPDLILPEHRGLNFETKRLFSKVGNVEQLQ